MPDLQNLRLGPAQVLYAGSDLGWTQGGVTVRVADTYSDIVVDQHGSTIMDKINAGTEVSVEINFAELDLDLLATITGETKETGTTVPTEERVIIGSRSGCSLVDSADSLVLKPMECGVPTTDENRWITFPQAAFESAIEQTFDAESQQVWTATAHCFPDPNNNMQIVIFGKETFTP